MADSQVIDSSRIAGFAMFSGHRDLSQCLRRRATLEQILYDCLVDEDRLCKYIMEIDKAFDEKEIRPTVFSSTQIQSVVEQGLAVLSDDDLAELALSPLSLALVAKQVQLHDDLADAWIVALERLLESLEGANTPVLEEHIKIPPVPTELQRKLLKDDGKEGKFIVFPSGVAPSCYEFGRISDLSQEDQNRVLTIICDRFIEVFRRRILCNQQLVLVCLGGAMERSGRFIAAELQRQFGTSVCCVPAWCDDKAGIHVLSDRRVFNWASVILLADVAHSGASIENAVKHIAKAEPLDISCAVVVDQTRPEDGARVRISKEASCDITWMSLFRDTKEVRVAFDDYCRNWKQSLNKLVVFDMETSRTMPMLNDWKDAGSDRTLLFPGLGNWLPVIEKANALQRNERICGERFSHAVSVPKILECEEGEKLIPKRGPRKTWTLIQETMLPCVSN